MKPQNCTGAVEKIDTTVSQSGWRILVEGGDNVAKVMPRLKSGAANFCDKCHAGGKYRDAVHKEACLGPSAYHPYFVDIRIGYNVAAVKQRQRAISGAE